MWEVAETIIYIVLFVMFLLTFWSQESRDRLMGWIGRGLREVWAAISPAVYKTLTGSVPDRVARRYVIVNQENDDDAEDELFEETFADETMAKDAKDRYQHAREMLAKS